MVGRLRWRGVLWALASVMFSLVASFTTFGVAVAIGGGAGDAQGSGLSLGDWPVLGSSAWRLGALAYGVLLLITPQLGDRGVRRVVVSAVLATLVYALVTAITYAMLDGSSDVASSIASVVVYGTFVWFALPAALAAPLLVALPTFFRTELMGAPARWAAPRYDAADDDAAAEDWNIH